MAAAAGATGRAVCGGGATDIISRVLAQELGDAWKQTVVVENKVGAGGGVGASQVARAKPDGYTMLMISGSMFTVNPYLYKKLPYSVADFQPVSIVTTGPLLLAVNKNVPATNLKTFLDYAKKNGAATNFGSAGVGSQGHMASEAIMNATDATMTHIPYGGESAALTDLVAGQIQVITANLSATLPFVRSGDIKALAVTGNKRSKSLPDVPSMQEQLGSDFDVVGWFGIVVPKNTPEKVVARIEEGIKTAIASKRMTQKFAELGLEQAPIGAPYMNDRSKRSQASGRRLLQNRKSNRSNDLEKPIFICI
ncbi:extra-cytoplasmic solute receptor family protein 21 [Advenella kashmirensis WT001]|uniref:Extra-cytoplasmic solute receptor family protein 21 n=1 Tax=Advenella kashmirensis (strain DSM 17095 / LMG 22695 / WT001) TaxID=1036672 RepID=I3U831_ADVKW|nr:tripartite tricarboxylate transporter substrate binding protein [Advenella kashmirensis]AFK61169.1 extra-cytoplasmic solute receptor family protein 21 [Advenella kashmirensis WT001]